ncbi:hypothetical protein CRUP_024097, partial [Coryphaenoides rupestris]
DVQKAMTDRLRASESPRKRLRSEEKEKPAVYLATRSRRLLFEETWGRGGQIPCEDLEKTWGGQRPCEDLEKTWGGQRPSVRMLDNLSRRSRSLLSLCLTSLALSLSVMAFCTSYWCEGTHKVVKPLCLSPVKMKNCGQNNSQPYTTGKI